MNFFDACNLSSELCICFFVTREIQHSNVDVTGPPTQAEGTFDLASPTSEAQSQGAQNGSYPPLDQLNTLCVQDIIRSLPEDAGVDADPPLLSPGTSTVDVDDSLNFEPGELGTDSDTENGSSGLSAMARNSETMGEGRGGPPLPRLTPNRTPTPTCASTKSSSSASSSDDGANGEHTEMEWEPTPPRPRLESRTFSECASNESEPDEITSQDDMDDGYAVAPSSSVPPDPSSEQIPADTQLSNLPRILVPCSDPSSLSPSRVHVAPESEPRILSTPVPRPNNTSFDVQMETQDSPDQTLPPLERSAKRCGLVSPEETKCAPPEENIHRQAHGDSPGATRLCQPSEPRSSRRSGGQHVHSGSERSERLVSRNGGYAFGFGKARRPGSNRPSFIANPPSEDELTCDTSDESGSEPNTPARPVRVHASSKAGSLWPRSRINGTPRKARKSEADVFLSTPRSSIPVLSIPSSRFSLQNLRRSPSPPCAITNSLEKRRAIPTSTGAASTTMSCHFSPADMLSRTRHEDVSDTDGVHRRSTILASSSSSGNMSLRTCRSLDETGAHNYGSAVQYGPQMGSKNSFNVFRPHRSLSDWAIMPAHADNNHYVRRRSSIIPGKHPLPPSAPQPISGRRHLGSNSFDDVPAIDFKLNRKRAKSSLESSTKRTSSDFDFGNSSNKYPIIARSSASTSTTDRLPTHSRSQSRNAPPQEYFNRRNSHASSSPLTNNDPTPRVHNDNDSQQQGIAAYTYTPESRTLHHMRPNAIANPTAHTRSTLAAAGPSSNVKLHAGHMNIAAATSNTKQPGPVSLATSTSSPVRIRFAPPYTRGYFTTAKCIEIIRRTNELRRTTQAQRLHLQPSL